MGFVASQFAIIPPAPSGANDLIVDCGGQRR